MFHTCLLLLALVLNHHYLILMNSANNGNGGSSYSTPSKSSLVPVVALFIFTSFISWLIGYMSWTWLLLLPILSITFWIIKRRINHYETYKTWCIRRNAARERLETHVESTEWLNHMMDKIWTVLEPIVSSEAIKNVNTLLKDKKPAFLVRQSQWNHLSFLYHFFIFFCYYFRIL